MRKEAALGTEELAVIESKALSIATEAHAGQVDKAGCDYIEHPKAVADRCSNRECRIVALLHDTIEDTFVTADYLREHGIPEHLVQAVLLVTKDKSDPGYNYGHYLQAIKANPIARAVKLADLSHNMDLSRLPQITPKAIRRQMKYRVSYRFLAAEAY
jgi:(p)ppGpp synthase/HD superfamily hydrolase